MALLLFAVSRYLLGLRQLEAAVGSDKCFFMLLITLMVVLWFHAGCAFR